jgi:glycine/D-amino acid oxidase-like deaminating enzyme
MAAAALPLPPSIYAETARPPVPTPPLDGDLRCDVAVVGGGYTGLSAALHLAEAGIDVAVLEAHEPGWGASGRNGGQVNPGLKHDPDDVERHFGAERGARLVEAAWSAPQAFFELIARLRIDCEARQTGTVRAATSLASARAVRVSGEQAARRGMPVEILERNAIARVSGTNRYICALLDRRGGSLNPLGFARGLAEAAMRAGARIFGATPALSLSRDGGIWRIVTQSGVVTAEQAILATNGYTDDLWPGLRRSVVPVYSAIAATAPLPNNLADALMPTRSVVYELGHITTYYRLDVSNRLLMGGRSVMRDLRGLDDAQVLIRAALALWPRLAGVAWTNAWNGQIAATADHYPHLHEPAPGVHIGLRYNGRGVAIATIVGQWLARRAAGVPADDIPLPVTPIGAIRFHGFWRPAVSAITTIGRARDRMARRA